MSRSAGLARTLQLSADQCRMLHVEPTGDCFYECMHKLLPDDGREDHLSSADAMRDFVADSLSKEMFDMYRMYAAAGVEDFAWLHHHHAPQSLEELKEYARRRGREHGAGQCLWADEHAIQAIAREAKSLILIVDDQAMSRGLLQLENLQMPSIVWYYIEAGGSITVQS